MKTNRPKAQGDKSLTTEVFKGVFYPGWKNYRGQNEVLEVSSSIKQKATQDKYGMAILEKNTHFPCLNCGCTTRVGLRRIIFIVYTKCKLVYRKLCEIKHQQNTKNDF